MSDTVVSLLTPPGTGAIATLEVRGPRAWEFARHLFKPAGKPLPESPDMNRFWFGTLGSDEVVLAATANDTVEVHCHGGRRVVRWVTEQFLAAGAIETLENPASGGRKPPESTEAGEGGTLEGLTHPARLLQYAPTLRTASILLDQLNGAFTNEVRRILALLETDPRAATFALHRLAELGKTVGRHLVESWKVVVAGPPNVGKSSLVNALAGYQRAVVSDVAGTTRDAVSVRTAFDGWPVELIDTAGLRDAEGLEAEGIERARRVLREAEFVVWVMDASSQVEVYPDLKTESEAALSHLRWALVMNKADRSIGWPPNYPPGAVHLSATTGENVPQLVDWIAYLLVRNPPLPGAAVPFTPQLADFIEAANAALIVNQPAETARLLREALAEVESHHFASPAGLSS